MSTRGPVAILHGAVGAKARSDELDVLAQVEAVSTALSGLGYTPLAVPLDLDLERARIRLRQLRASLVFNLVESIAGSDRLQLLAAFLLDHLEVPYTGAGANGLYLSSDKRLSKRWLQLHGLPTPSIAEDGIGSGAWIIKPAFEHASFGLDDSAVVENRADLARALALRRRQYGGEWFAERYIEGREFNLGLLAHSESVQVLPIAEMLFCDYPPHKPCIVDYRAKWDPASFEYQHTVRSFAQRPGDLPLHEELSESARRCWQVFGLCGYARVDFRVDRKGEPWILEVNPNPCLSPDAGFAAALTQAEISFSQAVARIVEAAEQAGLNGRSRDPSLTIENSPWAKRGGSHAST